MSEKSGLDSIPHSWAASGGNVVKKLIVAAVQMDAQFGQRQNNLAKAETLIQRAVDQGAKLVLLPEMLPYGYGLDESVWEGAEPIEGSSVQWLKNLSKKFGVYLGFTFLEVEGEDFYNSFVLSQPDGTLAERVRKSPPASIEAYFYRQGDDSHIVDTELGRIGVNICYESLLHERVNALYEAGVDLLLQPSATGRPKPFIPGDVARFENMLLQARKHHYQALGVPVIFANRIGKLEGKLPGWLPYLKSSFPGGSYISDSDGRVLAELSEEEGVMVSEITLDPQRKAHAPPKRYGKRWAVPVPWYSFIWPLTQKWGEKAYQGNERRRIKARQRG